MKKRIGLVRMSRLAR